MLNSYRPQSGVPQQFFVRTSTKYTGPHICSYTGRSKWLTDGALQGRKQFQPSRQESFLHEVTVRTVHTGMMQLWMLVSTSTVATQSMLTLETDTETQCRYT